MVGVLKGWKNFNKRMQGSADKLNPHWFFVYLAILVLIVDVIIVIIYLANTFIPEPPIYIILAQLEFKIIESSTEPYDSGLDKFDVSRFQLIDICGDRYLIQLSSPMSYEQLKTSYKGFVRLNQENLTYSVSIITDRKEGKIPLRIYSDRSDFEIQKNTEAIEGVTESSEIGESKGKVVNINLGVHDERHELLFDIIPSKDTTINLACIENTECVIININYILTRIPSNMDSILMTNLCSKEKILDGTYPLPPPNFNDTTMYALNVDTRKFEIISVKNQNESSASIDFHHPLPCTQESSIFLK